MGNYFPLKLLLPLSLFKCVSTLESQMYHLVSVPASVPHLPDNEFTAKFVTRLAVSKIKENVSKAVSSGHGPLIRLK